MKRVFKSGHYITEEISTERMDTFGDEPAFSVLTVVTYNAPISDTALKVWEKHKCTFQYDDFIDRTAKEWRSNNVAINVRKVQWGKPIKGSKTWGRLRIEFKCYGLLDEVEHDRIKAIGAKIRKGLTLLAKDLA